MNTLFKPRGRMSNEQRLANLRARWKRQAADRRASDEFKRILPAKQNVTCGMQPERKMAALKLEVHRAIDQNFWGKGPADRPKTDPGCGGFRHYRNAEVAA